MFGLKDPPDMNILPIFLDEFLAIPAVHEDMPGYSDRRQQKYSPEKLEILTLKYVNSEEEARRLEKQTHQQLKKYHCYREWFNIPQTIQKEIQHEHNHY